MKKLFVVGIIILSIFVLGIGVLGDHQSEHALVEVTVKKGDTLWEIAKEYKEEGEDIRAFIYEIKKENNLQSVNIQPGETILIPVTIERMEEE